MSRILIIRGGALGDFILTLPAIRLLRDSFASAHLEVLGYQHIVALATMSDLVDATRSIEYGPLSSFFSRDGDLAPALVEYFSSFQQVVSYLFDPDEIFADNLRRSGVRNLIVGSPKITDQEHAARQLARPLESLALYLGQPFVEMRTGEPQEVDPAWWAIHPGSGSEGKNWPLERFVVLARSLLEEDRKLKLLLVGGEADEMRLAKLADALPNDRIRVARNLPLPVLADRLQSCGIFLGHDSGVSHLAAAVGAPSLLLFGPTDPAIWAPQNPQVRVLRSSGLTMEGIGVAEVMAAMVDLRKQIPSERRASARTGAGSSPRS